VLDSWREYPRLVETDSVLKYALVIHLVRPFRAYHTFLYLIGLNRILSLKPICNAQRQALIHQLAGIQLCNLIEIL
jgi:hypothetical protein